MTAFVAGVEESGSCPDASYQMPDTSSVWLWFAVGVPFGAEVGVGEPKDGGLHGLDGLVHVGEVDFGEFVGGLVVVGVQAEAGDGVGDDALLGEGVVVGALEEFLVGVGIVDEAGAVFGEFGAEVGAVEAGEPESAFGDEWVWAADHLEFEVGDDAGKRDRWVLEEGRVAEAAQFFGSEEGEDDGAFGSGAVGDGVHEGEDGGGAGGVVVSAVVDQIGAGAGF